MTSFKSIGAKTSQVLVAAVFIALAGLFGPAMAQGVLGNPVSLPIDFSKSGTQIDCDYIQYEIGFNNATIGLTANNKANQFIDKLPAGLTWVPGSVTYVGTFTDGPGGGVPVPQITDGGKTLSVDNMYWQLDPFGSPDWFIIRGKVKINRSVLFHGDTVENMAEFHFGGLHPLRTTPLGEPHTYIGKPHKITLDLENCDTPPGDGTPWSDEACFKVETGVVECDPKNPGVFIYKMTVGAEFGGKVIELVSTTPGVWIFPPSQVVPLGGGVLEWEIHGAIPGMIINIHANGLNDIGDIKHIAGPKDGLGLCCTQQIKIIIPIDIDCPVDCKPGDDDCPPPPPPPPPPPCDPQWEDCPCDPKVEKCDPPETKKPDLRLEKKVIDEWCLPNGDGTALCTYQIRIWNAGGALYNGPVSVRDQYPNGAPIQSTFAPTPPWACFITGNPSKFVCNGNVKLAPGAQTFITVQAKVSINGYPSRKVKNCAYLKEQNGQPKSCAIAKLPDPQTDPKSPDLDLTKTCKNLESFADTGKQSVMCRITITNNGDAAAIGPLSINDVTTTQLGGGAIAISNVLPDAPAADWSCSPVPANNLNCSIDGSKVGPGNSRYFDVLFHYDRKQQGYKNCAEGLMQGKDDVHTFDNACVKGGDNPPTNPDEPNDISVEKTGDDTCEPEKPCQFEITLSNGNNKGFNGQIAIVDGITNSGGGLVAGATVSINPPFGCAVEPTSLPFGCVATVSLGGGESRTHQVTVVLPETARSAVVPLSQTSPVSPEQMSNCFMVGEPGILDAELGELVSTAPGNRKASGPASKRTSCHIFNVVKRPTEQCTNGMVQNQAGNCECPAGTRWNGRRCFGKPDISTVPPVDPYVPPVIGKNPVCPAGTTRFRSFKGRPLGYALKWVKSNGKRIVCGQPVCGRGWTVYNSRSAIPGGWDKKQIGRKNSKYKFWCAKPRKIVTPELQCWNGWEHITADEIYSYRKDGYQVKTRTKGRRSIACARPLAITPPLQCWSGWTKIWLGETTTYKRKGYRVTPRRKGNQTIWCAKPRNVISCVPGPNEVLRKGKCVCKPGYRQQIGVSTTFRGCVKIPTDGGGTFTPPASCWSGWTTISFKDRARFVNKGYQVKARGGRGIAIVWCAKPGTGGGNNDRPSATLQCWDGWSKIKRSQRTSFKRNGYTVKSRRKGIKRIWCAKPKAPAFCKGRNEYNAKGDCICKAGYKRNSKYQCVKKTTPGEISTTPPKLTCWAGWTKISGSKRNSYRRKGYIVKMRKSGRRKAWCVKPGIKKTCKQLGKLGKYPKCYNKPVISVRPGKKPTLKILSCAQIGKVGKWPKCYKKPVRIYKPKKTFKPIRTFKPKKKTCAQKGLKGKWPNCYRPEITFKPKPKKKFQVFKPKQQQLFIPQLQLKQQIR